MLKNYFKIAWRNLWKRKAFTFINIGGLTLGLAVGLLALLWVQDELSFDRFHTHGDRIYFAVVHVGSGADRQTWKTTPGGLAPAALQSVPAVESAVRIVDNRDMRLFRYGDKKFIEKAVAYADPSLFSTFSFPLVQGDPAKPFKNNQSIVITESVARKYFDGENPLGKLFQVEEGDYYEVSGVIGDIPGNSSIRYSIFFPFDILVERGVEERWDNYNYQTYFRLNEKADPEKAAVDISRIILDLKSPSDVKETEPPISLQPLHDIHLYKPDGSEAGIKTVRIFVLVAVIILLIACINYVNLTTARASARAQEVGVRKSIGAERMQLFSQFIGESLLMFVLAAVIALALVWLLLPLYNYITGKTIPFDLDNSTLWLTLGASLGFIIIFAGIYPAAWLSSFNPLSILRGRSGTGGAHAALRKGLVVLQFLIATGLIIAAVVIQRQLSYVQQRDMGYDRENILVIDLQGKTVNLHAREMKEALKRTASVESATITNQEVINMLNFTSSFTWSGKPDNSEIYMRALKVDEDFLTTMGVRLLEGENFRGTQSDSAGFLLNQTAAAYLGGSEAIGMPFSLWGQHGRVTGIVKDFNVASLHTLQQPVILLQIGNNSASKMYVRLQAGNLPAHIATVEDIWHQYFPGYTFNYSFLDANFQRLYQSEQRTEKLFIGFAAIAVFISILGLWGLATFTIEQRTKEIGIRKVIGASVTNVLTLLSKDFIKLVIIAIVIAIPIAWYAMNQWLENFAYRTHIEWWVFALAGLLTVLVALLTVSFQSVKAALMNPVKSLRSE